MRHKSRGQSATEYLVALAVVTALLVAVGPDGSALQAFLDAVRTAWSRLIAALSLPV